jgi:hypothetical protein
MILDYGLTDVQREKLTADNIKVIKGVKDGGIVNIRYRDILNFFNKTDYEQIMSCDGGILFFSEILWIFFPRIKRSFVLFMKTCGLFYRLSS